MPESKDGQREARAQVSPFTDTISFAGALGQLDSGGVKQTVNILHPQPEWAATAPLDSKRYRMPAQKPSAQREAKCVVLGTPRDPIKLGGVNQVVSIGRAVAA